MIDKTSEFNDNGININKKRIILTHTSREAESYLASLSFRYNSNYDKIPNFLVKKDGTIIKLIDECRYTNYFKADNKNSIIITLENLGWLNRENDVFINWCGQHSSNVHTRTWRDYDYWDEYTESQMSSLIELTIDVCEKMGIKKAFIGHNTIDNEAIKFEGVVNRSNFNIRNTDLSPAFDFNEFKKNIEYE